MNPSIAKNELEAAKAASGFQRNVIYSLIVLLCILAFGWLWTVMNSSVIVVPPEVKRPYEIGANHANKDYLGDMAGYVLQQVLTVSADSVDYNNKIILKMTDPDGYGQLKTELESAAIKLKRDRVSTVWVPQKETAFEREMVVRVQGRLKTYIADALTSTRDKEYLVQFTNTNSGRLYVLKVQEVLKADPAARRSGEQPG